MIWGNASASAKTLLVLPMAGDSSGGTGDLNTINRVYREALTARYYGEVPAAPEASTPCGDRECALKAAKISGADEVIYSHLYRLGSNWVFRSSLLNAISGEIFTQRLTALSIEDMEAATRRMAGALLSRVTVEQAATTDNLTAKESAQTPGRRRSFYSGGMALGYLWPVGSSFSYREKDPRYLNPPQYPLKTNSRLMHFTWMNTWELRNDLLLNGELAVEPTDMVPIVGGDLTINHLFGRSDLSPFLGGGLGLHFVTPDADSTPAKRNSGPTLLVQGGLMLFRTYDIHVLLRGQYRLILNSDLDNGFVTDVAVTYKMNNMQGKKDDYFTTKIIGFSALTLVLFGLIWGSSH